MRPSHVCFWEFLKSWRHLYTEASLRDIFAHIVYVNPLRSNFFRGNINIYLNFVSFLHIDTTQVVEILPQIRQEPTYFT